jgi:hypothetical protein
MNRKVRVGREIQREDFLHQRFFVVGRDGQRAIIVFDRVYDVSLPGVAGTKQRDRDLRGWILLERLRAGRNRLSNIAREDSDLRFAPPGGLQHGIDSERRIKIGFRPGELRHLRIEPAAVGQNLVVEQVETEGRLRLRLAV